MIKFGVQVQEIKAEYSETVYSGSAEACDAYVTAARRYAAKGETFRILRQYWLEDSCIPGWVVDAVIKLYSYGDKVSAIKMLRAYYEEQTRKALGLKEAKNFCDEVSKSSF